MNCKLLTPFFIRSKRQFDVGDRRWLFQKCTTETRNQFFTVIETHVSDDHRVMTTHQWLHLETRFFVHMKSAVTHANRASKLNVTAVRSIGAQSIPKNCQLLSLPCSDGLAIEVVYSR